MRVWGWHGAADVAVTDTCQFTNDVAFRFWLEFEECSQNLPQDPSQLRMIFYWVLHCVYIYIPLFLCWNVWINIYIYIYRSEWLIEGERGCEVHDLTGLAHE